MIEKGEDIWREKPIRQEPLEREVSEIRPQRCEREDEAFEEFDSLLNHDFENILLENPPLEGEFNPQEELQKIKKLSREERKEALSVFKNKLERQREAWANCRVFLERIIEFDNDAPENYLQQWLRRFGGDYGFTMEHYKLTNKIIDDYYRERKRLLEYVDRHGGDLHEAASNLTGINLNNKKKIGVDVGPVALNIEAKGRDYNKIKKEENLSRNTLGFYKKDLSTGIGYNVIKSGRESEATRTHEEEHAKNEILFHLLHTDYNFLVDRTFFEYDIEREKDEERKKEMFERYIKSFQREALLKAKNEITAYKKNGHDISSLMFFDDSAYDYLEGVREKYAGKEEEELVNTILIQEYKKILDDAIMAFNALERKDYTTEQVIALLGDKRLEEWGKTARRVIEERR